MKIFRYKVTIDGIERIVSIGVNTNTEFHSNCVFVFGSNNIQYVRYGSNQDGLVGYQFAHTILNPNDKHDERIELGRLTKMINVKDYKYNFTIPTTFNSYGAMKSFAFSYCTKIMHDWCDTRGIKTKIKVEDHII